MAKVRNGRVRRHVWKGGAPWAVADILVDIMAINCGDTR